MITNLVVPTKTNSFGCLISNCWKKIGDKFGVDAAEAEKKFMNTRTGTMFEVSSEPKVCAFDVLSFQCQVFYQTTARRATRTTIWNPQTRKGRPGRPDRFKNIREDRGDRDDPNDYMETRLKKQNVKTSILVFCRERERQSTNHFNLHAALRTKLLNFHIHTPSGKTKKKRMSSTNKKRENGKLKIQQPSSLTFPS